MRHLVVFVLRLWIDSADNPASLEGQVECIPTGERAHIRSEHDIARFIHERVAPCAADETRPNRLE